MSLPALHTLLKKQCLNNSPWLVAASCLTVILLVTSCSDPANTQQRDTAQVQFQVPEGFVLEKLYEPGLADQGSWVSLARGPGTTFFAGDQFGAIYQLKLKQSGSGLLAERADSLPLNLGYAQGLLWFQDTLYISVNRPWEDTEQGVQGSGIYRAWDSDDDQKPDSWDQILKLQGYGEHGPHSLVLKPDQSGFVLVAGNHTRLPARLMENSRVPVHWAEDQILAPFKDPRGHATDITPPGGWVASYEFTNSKWELLSTGYRNPFDLAFLDNELFTYDSDMEWDMGMPWYRPTRICHVSSGSEYGWRTGSGKWPDTYPDNLPAVVSMLQGSPTALLAGHKLDFPDSYLRGLFAADWSFGTLYYVAVEPNGATFTGTRKEFLTGSPLPLTDMSEGPDGQLYFLSGGRELESALYRLRWEGAGATHLPEITTAATTPEAALRHKIEAFQGGTASEEDLEFIWQNLSHSDRFIRFASRIALEHQPVSRWASRLKGETSADAVISAGIALSRLNAHEWGPEIHQAYLGLEWDTLSNRQRQDLVRAVELAFIRLPDSVADFRDNWIAKLNGKFPGAATDLNMALAELLVFLEAPDIIPTILRKMESLPTTGDAPKEVYLSEEVLDRSEQYGPSIRKMLAAQPPREALHYTRVLSRAVSGWTPDLRRRYYKLFFDWFEAEGGMSFKAYLEQMRTASLSGLTASEVREYEKLSGIFQPVQNISDLPEPIGPGNTYTMEMLNPYVWGDALEQAEASIEAGERAYKAALCIVCHRMNGEGGLSGPDLSQIGSKFSRYDLAFAILSPNDQISDQYANTLLELQTGEILTGRIREENDSLVVLMPNPFDPNQQIQVDRNTIARRRLSPVSPMPSGLLNRLGEAELRELLVFLLANGDAGHPLYTGISASE